MILAKEEHVIAYSHRTNHFKSYPIWEMTNRFRKLQPDIMSARNPELYGDEDKLFEALYSTLLDIDHWSIVCKDLLRALDCEAVALAPLSPRADLAPYVALSQLSDTERFATELAEIADLIASQSRSLDSFSSIRSFVVPLDFGIDGIWLFVMHKNNIGEEDLKFRSSLLKTLRIVAMMTANSVDLALRTMTSIHQRASVPFAVIDVTGRVISFNQSFAELRNGVFLSHTDSIVPSNREDVSRLAHAVHSTSPASPSTYVVFRGKENACITKISLLPESSMRLRGQKLLGLTIHGLTTLPAQNSRHLEELFGLTQREADVASMLATGVSAHEIAATHDVSVGTIRVQLKAIFRKLGVNSQIQLVSKILSCRFD